MLNCTHRFSVNEDIGAFIFQHQFNNNLQLGKDLQLLAKFETPVYARKWTLDVALKKDTNSWVEIIVKKGKQVQNSSH